VREYMQAINKKDFNGRCEWRVGKYALWIEIEYKNAAIIAGDVITANMIDLNSENIGILSLFSG
jgi:hypothetical protein